MREIKFRAWDRLSKQMFFGSFIKTDVDAPAIVFGDGEQVEVEEDKVGQFTGLLDKNGVEIYEGDILKRDSGCICEVIFKKVNGRFEASGERHTILAHKFKLVEIIGNIHESSELLEPT